MDDRKRAIINASAKQAACRRRTVVTLLAAKCRIQGCIVTSECNTTREYTDLNEIYKHIVTYLEKYCDHTWTEDWIDLNPERSQKVVYCELCETVEAPKVAVADF